MEDNRQHDLGDWVGTQLTYRIRPSFIGDITVGVESKVDIRARMTEFDVSPVPIQFLSVDHPNRSLGLVFQDEKNLTKGWKVEAGLRFDMSVYGTNFVSPRVALLYQRSDWTVKFLYGRGFRNPSTYQLFYGDGLAIEANPNARAETANTLEVDLDRKLGKRMSLQVSAYGYRLYNFLEGVELPSGLIQYQNDSGFRPRASSWRSTGVRRPGSKRPPATRSSGRATTRSSKTRRSTWPSCASQTPLGRKFDISGGMHYQSSRGTLAGNVVNPVYLADFTLTSKRLLRDFDVRLGLRNAFNRFYSDPVELTPGVDTMPQPGRSFFVEMIAHRGWK